MTHGMQMHTILMVPPTDIAIGTRRRKVLGNLEALLESVRQHGIVEPLLVRQVQPDAGRAYRELVAGGRRHVVAMALKLERVPVIDFGLLSDEEARDLELAENTGRCDFTSYEASAKRLAELTAAAAEIQTEKIAKAEKTITKNGRAKPKATKATKKEIAERTGVSPQAQARIERHAAMVERFPSLESWTRGDVLAVEAAVTDKLPITTARQALKLTAGSGVLVDETVRVLETLAMLPAEHRAKLLAQDTAALTRACRTAPPAEPKMLQTLHAMLTMIHGVLKDARRMNGVSGSLLEAARCVAEAGKAVEASRDAALARWCEGR